MKSWKLPQAETASTAPTVRNLDEFAKLLISITNVNVFRETPDELRFDIACLDEDDGVEAYYPLGGRARVDDPESPSKIMLSARLTHGRIEDLYRPESLEKVARSILVEKNAILMHAGLVLDEDHRVIATSSVQTSLPAERIALDVLRFGNDAVYAGERILPCFGS